MAKRLAFISFFLFFLAGISSAQEEVIERITVLGNVKTEEGVIRGAIKSREGRPFSIEQVREDLRSIFALGYYSDVQLDIRSTPRGKEILFIVVERPSIREVLIKGNDKVKYDDIKEKVTLPPRSILNLDKVRENVEQIRKLYFTKGYYGVKVEPKIDTLETNEAVVTFQITEGPKGRIKEIVFKGNEKIKSSDLLKVMTTKKWNLLSWFTKTGVLDEDVLKNDIQLVTAYYIDQGYLDVKVSEPKIDLSNPKRIRIEIAVTEGSLYRLAKIDFKGDVLTTREDLFKAIQLKRNDVYSNSAIRRDIGALTERFAGRGYAYVEITSEPVINPDNLTVDLTFIIDKKKKVYLEKIQTTGNSKTRDKVIRRELLVAEGTLYDATALSKSQSRLRRTGYFKEVDFSTSRGTADDKINIDIKVEEAPTGSISLGVGYSTLYSVMASVALADRNLFGYGYHGVFRVTLGTTSTEFRLSFTDPYFLGYPYSVGADLYLQTIETFDTYHYQVQGGDVHAGKELTENLRLDAMYKLEKVKVYDVARDASDIIKEEEGTSTTSALSLTLIRDTRNDYFAPSKGGRHSIMVENAGGPLGGSNYFVKTITDSSWFFPLPLRTVLNLRGKAGVVEPYGGTEVPIYEKYFVGGQGTIRGFEYGMAGPVDENGDPVGATNMVVFTSEFIFPISSEIGMRGALFWDVGKGFDNTSDITPIKNGVGFGLRWYSPFGPINIDLGFNPNPKEGEKRRVWEFNMGTVY